MESVQDIQARIKSIGDTKQITESMRLISTRKVQKFKHRMEENHPYLIESVNMVKKMANNSQIARNPYVAERGVRNSLIILITSDRGLCGGYNVNVEKEAYALIDRLGNAQLLIIGTKGGDYFRRRKKPIIAVFKGMSENPLYENAKNIGSDALKMYDEKAIDQIFLVHTEYNSMLSQTPKITRLLPLERNEENTEGIGSVYFESGVDNLFDYAVSRYISTVLFGAMLMGAVSEQCARITGMDSAVKNSDKIINSLTLQYNQMRQGVITQEIAEIVSGANAVRQKND